MLSCCGSDPVCGPGMAADNGLELAGTGVDVHYKDLHASANNDCPDPSAPSGVISLTIGGSQDGSAFPVTLCIPRPDRLSSGALALGTDVKIIDLGADIGNGCTLARATTPDPTGTVKASGLCGNGKDPAGFALTFENGVVPMKRTCGAQVDVLNLALTGTVAVAGP
ncbi:MAG TPA: hypothetical protein VL463_25180 [Kofleriaceae bacterium]|nr:hypothetical protein [Kofleriaceae bacterium]